MPIEVFANNAETTLSAAITSTGVTSISVASAASFPASGQYRVLIDAELLIVAGGQGTTSWTVTRGAEGTTAATHSNGATVTGMLTAGGLDQRRADAIHSDVIANLPAAGYAGQLYLPQGGVVGFLDTGSGFVGIAPLYVVIPPRLADFAWVNQGTAVASDVGGIALSMPNLGNADSIAALVQTLPAPPWTVTVGMIINGIDVNYVSHGLLGSGASDTGRAITIQTEWSSQFHQISSNWNSPTSWNADAVTWGETNTRFGPIRWYRMQHDGTNLTRQFSADGTHWVQQLSEAVGSAFLVPTRAGPYVNAHGVAASCTIVHFAMTSP